MVPKRVSECRIARGGSQLAPGPGRRPAGGHLRTVKLPGTSGVAPAASAAARSAIPLEERKRGCERLQHTSIPFTLAFGPQGCMAEVKGR